LFELDDLVAELQIDLALHIVGERRDVVLLDELRGLMRETKRIAANRRSLKLELAGRVLQRIESNRDRSEAVRADAASNGRAGGTGARAVQGNGRPASRFAVRLDAASDEG